MSPTAPAPAPARFARRNHGSGHSYRLDGAKIPGVTTAIGVLDKPALKQWAANMAANEAIRSWDELATLDVVERLDRIRYAHKNTVRKASVRGTRIHAYGQKLAHGDEVTIPDEYAGPAQAYARFLDRWQLEPLWTELPVCHTGYRYGGTLDLIGTSPFLADGAPILLDVKTGGVYREVALQLGGYRHCDLALEPAPEGTKPPRGRKVPDPVAVPMPETAETAYVAHVLEDDVELVPVDASANTWKQFLYALQLYRWIQACEDDPPVGRAIWPESADDL